MTENQNTEPDIDLEEIPDAQTPNDDGPELDDVPADDDAPHSGSL